MDAPKKIEYPRRFSTHAKEVFEKTVGGMRPRHTSHIKLVEEVEDKLNEVIDAINRLNGFS